MLMTQMTKNLNKYYRWFVMPISGNDGADM